jgi:hypothetical protein
VDFGDDPKPVLNISPFLNESTNDTMAGAGHERSASTFFMVGKKPG